MDLYGALPSEIDRVFDLCNHQEGYEYKRRGVHNTTSSFLDCVLEGIEATILTEDLKEKEARQDVLNDIRTRLAEDPATVAGCRQEMYDFTTEEIQDILGNPCKYMDPRLFTGLLESVYKCNIYVFSRIKERLVRSGGRGEGPRYETQPTQLMIPRHRQAYYKNNNSGVPSIFIYEHKGSSSGHARYPRCELIFRWKTGGQRQEDIEYSAPYGSVMSECVRGMYDKLRESFALNHRIPNELEAFRFFSNGYNLLGQGIDSYGKCRMIVVEYNSVRVNVLTSPLQPLLLPEIEGWKVTPIKLTLAIAFAADMGNTHLWTSSGKGKPN